MQGGGGGGGGDEGGLFSKSFAPEEVQWKLLHGDF